MIRRALAFARRHWFVLFWAALLGGLAINALVIEGADAMWPVFAAAAGLAATVAVLAYASGAAVVRHAKQEGGQLAAAAKLQIQAAEEEAPR